MSYSLDFRQRVVAYVKDGGSKAEASRIFGIERRTLYHWLSAKDLSPRPAMTRKRKLDKAALAAHVRDYPDWLLRERAEHFGVHINAVWVALQRLRISKKNDEIF
jgi:putative transposase